MKHLIFLKRLFLGAMSLGMVLVAHAQGQDSNHEWVGNSLTSVIGNADSDMKTVYLYNVGTGRFLNAGHYWATVTIGYTVGMPIYITNSPTSGKYRMYSDTNTTEGSNIAFGRRKDTQQPENPINFNNVYIDRGTVVNGVVNGVLDWTFNDVGNNTYTIHCYNDETLYPPYNNMEGDIYLYLQPGTEDRLLMSYPHSVQSDDKYAQWKIVTLKDLKNAFKATFASDEKPADATFLIKDQNFSRSNVNIDKWVISGLSSHPKPENYSFYPDAGTYYVGMGSTKSNDYQAKYAAYWIGCIRNIGDDSHANGTVTQTVTVLRKGWYILSCDGFYNATNGSNMTSTFFANVQGNASGESNVSAELNRFNGEITYTVAELTRTYQSNTDPESPYVKIGKLFNKGRYENKLVVYVPTDNSKLDIGVKVTGSTENCDLTAFDNFQLKYCGDRDLILDEAQTSMDYISSQVETGIAKTLILKRTMTPGIWNSITLPVSLTAAQFKTAFGEQAKLSKLKGQDETIPTRIDFTAVDLSDNDKIVISPNSLYIMKPTRGANVTTGSYSKIISASSTITVQAPYYVINNISLEQTPEAEFKETSKITTTSDNKLQFCGTQIKHTSNHVPSYSYVLGANDGKWYYTQHDLPIKGFRCWIATGSEAQAKRIAFFIDGESAETTGVEAILTNGLGQSVSSDVYSLDGQIVRKNATSLEGLPKGIYIVNKKKYIVK